MIEVGWLLLMLGVAALLLGLAPYSPNPQGARIAPVIAAVLGGVVVILALIRIVD